MSDPDDYEALPATASLGVTCFAGALAGIAEHCVMFPIDSVKVRREAQEGMFGHDIVLSQCPWQGQGLTVRLYIHTG